MAPSIPIRKIISGKSLLLLAFLPLTFFSCSQREEIPFPENPNGWETPKPIPFSFPAEQTIQWDTIDSQYAPKKTTFPFVISQMPSKPFVVNDFKPLANPITEIPFDRDQLKKIEINWDTLKSNPIKVRKFLSDPPRILAASNPSVWRGGTSGMVKLGQAEGMIGNRILAMASDSLGVTWITTEQGLHKYDGEFFSFYNFFQKDVTGAIETLSDLIMEEDGSLLISSQSSGIYRFNPNLDLVEHYQMSHGFIRIKRDKSGQLWGAINTLYKIDLAEKKETPLPISSPNNDLSVSFGVEEDRDNNLWVGYNNTIGIVSPDRKSISLIGINEGLQIGVPFEFLEDKTGTLWISSFSPNAHGISLKDQKIKKIGSEQGFNGQPFSINQDFKDRLWFSANDTIFVLDPIQQTSRKIHTGSTLRRTQFPPASQLKEDGMLLQGTQADGILIYDTKGMMPEHFTTDQGLESNDVWGIAEDDQGRVYLSTYAGLDIYDPKTKRLHLFKLPSTISTNSSRRIRNIGERKFLYTAVGGFGIFDLDTQKIDWYDSRNTDINTVFFNGLVSKDNKFWFGGGLGVNVFDPVSGIWLSLGKAQGLAGNLAFVLEEDRQGRIWVASDTGLSILDPVKNTIRNIKKESGLPSDYTSMIYQNEAGEMIVGTDEGLSIFNPTFSEITHIGLKNGLIPPALYDIVENKGIIHIGSERGIIRVFRPTEQMPSQPWEFYNYGIAEGFPYVDFNQSTAKVLRNGQVWWGASPILTATLQEPILDLSPPKVHLSGIKIMDQQNHFIRIADIKEKLGKEDTLWTSNEGKFFLADGLPADSGYYVNNKFRWEGTLNFTGLPINLEVPHDQNSISFEFVNSTPRGRDKIQYSYILEGMDNSWSKPSSKSTSRIYYNLTPGTYTFKVASSDFNRRWSAPDTFTFTVLPPWNQTWWAYLIFLGIGGGIIYSVVQVRSAYLKKENRVLEEKVQHRTEQLKKSLEDLKTTQSQLIHSEKMASLGELTAGIAHEIQNPLNFVNNFSEVSAELLDELNEEIEQGNMEEVKAIAEDLKDNLVKISHHGKRADSIVKGMLAHSRGNSSQKSPTELNALLDECLRLSFHGSKAKDKGLKSDFKLDLDPELPKIEAVQQDLGRVFLNLINNAFYAVNDRSKTAGSEFTGIVTVSSKYNPPKENKEGEILISIADNGSGIPDSIKDKIFQPFFTTKPTGLGTGLGLSLSYDILKAHGGELKVESQEGRGTEFTIRFTLNID
ncbi:phospho-acceptor domain-containing protein [Algoriphagus boseongensis]|uniref:histidine kinase n=1 Tax=Algoriphagus boseongensis TaxID=1442587 RepID=A0A4R6T4Y0_9BACT|nr:ATP-binding protein [Algoriphagus boseongensis]TDQ17039.1 phospho-acceptor domain-containing protein [Algoriphagus boseongensis]